MDDLYTLLGRVDENSIVLDLGCGRGSFHYETCRGRIIALDVALPDKSARRREAAYVLADSSSIPLPDASVAAVVSHHTLEHFEDYKRTLSEIRRILGPDGWLWIAVPNGHGFDDVLYRFVFAGGGHVNRFRYDALVAEVEMTTRTHLVRSCDLFSSFIYLRKPPADELQHYPAKAGFLRDVPDGFLTFGVLAINAATRLIDKIFGLRLSQYGWGFVFSRALMSIEPMPSYFNVCRLCGSGNSAALITTQIHSLFGLGLYHCTHCRELNVFVSPPPNLQ